MKAIFLTAGYATRLYPLTLDKPKALLEINEKPILDYILEQVNTIPEIDEIYVVSNHKFFGQLSRWAKTAQTDKKVIVMDDGSTADENRLGAIGDIQFAIDKAAIDDDVLIICGDNLFTFDLKNYYDYYKSLDKDCVCCKIVDDKDEIKGYAVAIVDENHKILDLEEKPQDPKSNIAVFATYFYKRATAPMFKTYLDEGNKPDAPGYFLQWLYKRKDVYAYEMDGICLDIGTARALALANEIFRNL